MQNCITLASEQTLSLKGNDTVKSLKGIKQLSSSNPIGSNGTGK